MSLVQEELGAASVREFFDSGQKLRIPPYQRRYSWSPRHALELLQDFRAAQFRNPTGEYAVGSVILLREPGQNHDDVVDGQQRLTTLRLMVDLLTEAAEFEVLLRQDTPVAAVYRSLRQQIRRLGVEERESLGRFVQDQGVLVRIVTDDPDEAFRIFDSQNFRGRALAPHDLLKAHHLREMTSGAEAERTAVVQRWENRSTAELEHLFHRVLYPLSQWIRDEPAAEFTSTDLHLFKGISLQQQSPSVVYHRAAQVSLPVYQQWTSWQTQQSSSEDDHDAQRARFPLDAPIQAGRTFFEMVEFQLEEEKRLRHRLFVEDGWATDLTPLVGSPRYRFINDLLVCAALYVVNRFGWQALDVALEHLISWAYSLRIDRFRVTWRGMNSFVLSGVMSSGRDRRPTPMFRAIRLASSAEQLVLQQLLEEVPAASRSAADEPLRMLLASLQAGLSPGESGGQPEEGRRR